MREDGTRDGSQPVEAPHLTVVIPAYNAVRTLGEQLDALAAQQAPFAWEVVVADNGSTDGTRALVCAAIERLPHLRLVDASATRGAGAARNAGVAEARGRAVAFCDADDVVSDGWVAAMGAGLAAHSCVAGRNDWSRLNRAAILASRIQDGVDRLEVSPDELRLLRAGTNNLGIRTDVFRRAGGFDLAAPAMEDIDLVWRLQLGGEQLVFLPDAVVHVRMRGALRSFLSQARAYGDGERWLDERYREVRAAAAVAAGAPQDAAVAAEVQPRTVGRVARRLAHVGRQAAAVRRRGDVNRLLWELAFGVGYAHGTTSRTGAPALPAALLGPGRARAAAHEEQAPPAAAPPAAVPSTHSAVPTW